MKTRIEMPNDAPLVVIRGKLKIVIDDELFDLISSMQTFSTPLGAFGPEYGGDCGRDS